MARSTNPLTDTQIRAAKPREKEYTLADGGGLNLRVRPNGAKIWLFNYYRPVSKKRMNISLGGYPETPLIQARRIREEYRALLTSGVDPKLKREQSAQEKHQRHAQTFSVVAKQWFDIKCNQVNASTGRPKLDKLSAKKVWRAIEIHLLPYLGSVPISQINSQMVIAHIQTIQAAGKYEIADRACSRLNEIMNFAVNSGIATHNPLTAIKSALASRQSTPRKAIAPKELPELMSAIRLANITAKVRLMMLWQLHTMTRPKEAAHARWDEIDLEERVWTIPQERMKMRKTHRIPLTDETVSILTDAKAINSNSEYIFPSERNYHQPASSQSTHMALKRMGYGGRLDAHGMRSIASTYLNEQGFNHEHIEYCLAHTVGTKVSQVYNRADYLEPRRRILSAWSKHILECESGAKTACDNNIIPLSLSAK